MTTLEIEVRPARVLVVEDNPSVRLLLEFYLVRAGYEVRTESLGEDAVRETRGFDPDAVVLDLNLPDIDGARVLREIRRDDGDRRRVVVVLTGTSEADPSLAPLRTAAESVESKPIAPSRLIRKLSALRVPPVLPVAREATAHVDLY